MEITIKYHGDTKPLERHGAAIDLSASETVEMKQGEVKIIPLGVSMKLPDGYFGFVASRSSTCLKHGIMAADSVGIIENEYCGDNDVWGFVAFATRDTTIEKGTRIAQFFALPEMEEVTLHSVESMPFPDRGGYGSTGAGTESVTEQGCVEGELIREGDVLFFNEAGLWKHGFRFEGMPLTVIEATETEFNVIGRKGNHGHFPVSETHLFTRTKPEGACNE